ncbi:acyl-ACP--UDP-N-acetylglucosamine O-acyltransferase [Candidatus Cyanaurora vandensis]|uniref:acyl-ACP--UDP-N-acetylglucosamine O-acyltransferase n=1 Tax=Candidatus Cyanaurora vandensis TaxID=2714958 RepID=UPI0025796848|nr:acyl-ACP--UDP-N-acetylglucosamine O-acyltransferase [Candidatus Cyanaurora vandensis]
MSQPTLMSLIHPTALVHPKAQLHPTVRVGPYSVVGEHVTIGPETEVMAQVVIDGWTEIGANNRIFPGAVIGGEPQDLKYQGAPSRVIIGNNNRLRECVTVNRATHEGECTVIGDDNLLMAYVHVAHNCAIADQVVISSSVLLAGHVTIESRAVIGGMLGIHQFVHVGRLSMVGGMSRVERDVPPFTMVEGNPARVRGLNLVGLARAGISPQQDDQTYALIRKAFRVLYRSGQTFNEALDELTQFPPNLAVDHLVHFLQQSLSTRRGPVPGSQKNKSVADNT